MPYLTLWQREDGGPYYASGTIGGRRVRKSLLTRDKETAERKLEEYEDDLIRKGEITKKTKGRRGPRNGAACATRPPPPVFKHGLPHMQAALENPTFRMAGMMYMRSRTTGSSPSTRRYIQRFADRLGDMKVRDFRFAQWELYVARYLSANLSPNTIRREGLALQALLNFSHRMGWCDRIKLAVPSEQKANMPFLPDDLFELALKHSRHDFARFITFLRYTGARPVEARELTFVDVDLTAQPPVCQLRWRKGRAGVERSRLIPLHPKAIEAIGIRPMQMAQETRVFRTAQHHRWSKENLINHWSMVRESAGIDPKYGMYSLRHSFGTYLARNRVPVHTIAALMGHSSLSMTMRYITSTSEDRIKAIMSF